LRELRDPAARGALLRALADPAAAVRRTALEALMHLPQDVETAAGCVSRLADVDPSVRATAIAAVAELDPRAADALRPVLQDPHPSVRAAAASAARALDAESVAVLLRDPEAEVRVAALEALSCDPQRDQTPLLLEALAASNWHVRRAAVDALGATGDTSVTRNLVDALVDPHSLVRGRALLALERLVGDGLDELLATALADTRAQVRRALVEILGRRGCVAQVVELSADPDPAVRLTVLHALEDASGDDAKMALAQLADDPDVTVRHAAAMLRAVKRRSRTP
jgi:HEAT repeat protein